MQRRLFATALVISAGLCGLSLTGCATSQPPAPVAAQPICLPMASYTHAEQARAADELQALTPGATLGRFMVDYGQLRAANRALCAK